jgi:hypothetical protein
MGRLSLDFEDVILTLGLERKSDGKLYYPAGVECNFTRSLSTSECCEREYSNLDNLTLESQKILDQVRWI